MKLQVVPSNTNLASSNSKLHSASDLLIGTARIMQVFARQVDMQSAVLCVRDCLSKPLDAL